MNVIAFIVTLAAAIVFLVEFVQTRSTLALGLCLFSTGFILTFVLVDSGLTVIR